MNKIEDAPSRQVTF